MINRGMMSSDTDLWATPQDLFDSLNAEFGPFDVDVCANDSNFKCSRWIGWNKNGGGLVEVWGGRCWMNPPYGREIGKWMKKAYESSLAGALVCCLVPARTDTKWWHDYAMKGTIRFLRGRVKFGGKGPAPFPSAVVIFAPASARSRE